MRRAARDGALYVANNGGVAPAFAGGAEVRRSADRRMHSRRVAARRQLAPTSPSICRASRPWRPNDSGLQARPATIVFTDPPEIGRWLQDWDPADPALALSRAGQLLLAGAGRQGHAGWRKMTGFPNGLAFHPDGSPAGRADDGAPHRAVPLARRPGRPRPAQPGAGSMIASIPNGMIFVGDRLFANRPASGDRIANHRCRWPRHRAYRHRPRQRTRPNLCLQGKHALGYARPARPGSSPTHSEPQEEPADDRSDSAPSSPP